MPRKKKGQFVTASNEEQVKASMKEKIAERLKEKFKEKYNMSLNSSTIYSSSNFNESFQEGSEDGAVASLSDSMNPVGVHKQSDISEFAKQFESPRDLRPTQP
jgi:superfamily II RNA helicase